MKYIVVLFFIFISSVFANFIDIDVQRTNNYVVKEKFFLDYQTTESHTKEMNGLELNLDLNFNDMGGIKYKKIDFFGDNEIESKTLYIGSDETIYFSYTDGSQDIFYSDGNNRDSSNTYKKFIFFDMLSVEQYKFKSNSIEDYVYYDSNQSLALRGRDNITRKYNKEIYKISSEGFYRLVKKKALEKKDFFYGVAGAKNFSQYFRIYGLGILSYEHHDYSDGIGQDSNGKIIKAEWGGSEIATDLETLDYYDGIKGKFKGYGYGYHLTAEAYYKEFSFFITHFYKITKMKNYHSGVLNFEPPEVDPETGEADDPVYELGVVRYDNFILKNQYLSFGIRYRF